MKIAVAQTRSVKGNVAANIVNHKKIIDLAISSGANAIIFPELSLTGYEPELAKELATSADDERFNDFQSISDTSEVLIGVGIPVQCKDGICIGMILFQPQQLRQVYYKQYLHPDEEGFFISGKNIASLVDPKNKLALAICYELSVAEHAEKAFKNGAEIYIASVAKSADGTDKAFQRLAEIADKYGMTVLFSNSLGPSDNFIAAGKTAAWNNKGEKIAQLDDSTEGILVIDTSTHECVEKTA